MCGPTVAHVELRDRVASRRGLLVPVSLTGRSALPTVLQPQDS